MNDKLLNLLLVEKFFKFHNPVNEYICMTQRGFEYQALKKIRLHWFMKTTCRDSIMYSNVTKPQGNFINPRKSYRSLNADLAVINNCIFLSKLPTLARAVAAI